MRAVICTDTKLRVGERPAPTPAAGQVLIDVLNCGICGSDLHARVHSDEVADLVSEIGYHDLMRSTQEVVLGHEFCGTIADYGDSCRRRWPTGTPVVALPILRQGTQVHLTGLSAAAPGGYAEQVVVQEAVTTRSFARVAFAPPPQSPGTCYRRGSPRSSGGPARPTPRFRRRFLPFNCSAYLRAMATQPADTEC